MMEERKMKTSRIKIEAILKDALYVKNHYKSKFSISPYGSRRKKHLYLFHIQKNNGGM